MPLAGALIRPPSTGRGPMEQCACVERELDKVLQKFLTYGQLCERSLEELLHYVGQLRAELAGAGACCLWPQRPRLHGNSSGG